ncbi:MAG: ABC transporter permease [Bacteroidales bacterium]|nr:ABC transporter permease [Bacteroidales bacterium]
MNFIIQTLSSLFRSGQSNLIKIVCLAVGLSLGLILIAKVCFENSLNSFFPDYERVFIVKESYKLPNDKEFNDLYYIPGGAATGFAKAIPQIELATRFTPLAYDDNKIVVDEAEHLSAHVWGADTCLFDLLGTSILIGNAKTILNKPGGVMVSRSMAEKMGGIEAAIGKKVRLEDMEDGNNMVIEGIFEDFPETFMVEADVLVSIHVMGENSTNNWMGNERYLSFVKLVPGASRDEVLKSMKIEQDIHVKPEWLENAGIEASFQLLSLDELINNDDKDRNLKYLMLFLGIALILISTLNYLLIVISTLINRVKEIAVYKCYGASWKFLLGITLRESAVHLTLALVMGAIIIISTRGIAENLLNASLEALFAYRTLIVIFIICVVLLAITAGVPTYIFSKIPVAAAFRNFKESKKNWKLVLLFVQFASTACIVGLLVTVTWQYNYIEKLDRGYDYEKIMMVNCTGVSVDQQAALMSDIRKMPGVEYVSSCFDLPFGLSGNNAHLPNTVQELFNIGDFYNITDDYFKVMGVDIIDGTAFNPESDNRRTIMISKKFVDRMHELGFWNESAIGKNIYITEHSNDYNDTYTIVGVYNDIMSMQGGSFDDRPTVMFYDGKDKAEYSHPRYLLIRMQNMDKETTDRINTLLSNAVTRRECIAESLKMVILLTLSQERNMRDALLICTIVALIISLLGLYGYTMDEINRRRKEIAIRKVLGTSSFDIMRIISQDITYIAIPALLIGAATAYYLSMELLKMYAVRIDPNVMLFIGIATVIYLVIMLSVALQLYRASNENPVNNLKAE